MIKNFKNRILGSVYPSLVASSIVERSFSALGDFELVSREIVMS